MLSTFVIDKRVSLCGPNETKVLSLTSHQTIHKGNRCTRCHHLGHGQGTDITRGEALLWIDWDYVAHF